MTEEQTPILRPGCGLGPNHQSFWQEKADHRACQTGRRRLALFPKGGGCSKNFVCTCSASFFANFFAVSHACPEYSQRAGPVSAVSRDWAD